MAAKEVHALDAFHAMLGDQPDRAYFGLVDVVRAYELGAVATLLLTDALFRSSDVAQRRQYVDMSEAVKAAGGEVCIFSTMHVSGEQLNEIGGLAAILRFPLPELEEDGDDDEEDDGDDGRP